MEAKKGKQENKALQYFNSRIDNGSFGRPTSIDSVRKDLLGEGAEFLRGQIQQIIGTLEDIQGQVKDVTEKLDLITELTPALKLFARVVRKEAIFEDYAFGRTDFNGFERHATK